MTQLHSAAVSDLLAAVGPSTDAVLEAMTVRADREDFPTVGPEVGRALACCTRLAGARSVLELGSGFGYSAYWVARALPPDGEMTLTERDPDLLADAREHFERGGLADKASFECVDALEYADSLDADDSFDLVVLDHDTGDYVAGFERVRDLVAPGGAVLVDNVAVYEDVLTPEGLVATLDGEAAPNERTRAVAAFLRTVREDEAFEATLLPVGEGLAVCTRV